MKAVSERAGGLEDPFAMQQSGREAN